MADTYTVKQLNFAFATVADGRPANKVFSITVQDSNAKKKNIMLFADVERLQKFDRTSKFNKNCLLSVDSNADNKGNLVHALYETSQNFYKSAIYAKGKMARTETTYDFQNITNHKLIDDQQLTSAIQVDNILYGLQQKSVYGRYDIATDIYSYISANNGMTLPISPTISTAIYNRNAIQEALSNDSIEDLQRNAVSANLNTIEYNMIYEIPGNVYNDYDSGNIAANTFKCKNNLNAEYDMMHNENYGLKHARDYTSIQHCNNQVYLTYNDNINYGTDCNKIEDLSTQYGFKCDKIELLNQMNRYAKLSGHKTNLYSIAIYTDLFKKLNSLTAVRDRSIISEKLKKELKNVVRDMTQKLAPVNTQLFSVNVVDI